MARSMCINHQSEQETGEQVSIVGRIYVTKSPFRFLILSLLDLSLQTVLIGFNIP